MPIQRKICAAIFLLVSQTLPKKIPDFGNDPLSPPYHDLLFREIPFVHAHLEMLGFQCSHVQIPVAYCYEKFFRTFIRIRSFLHAELYGRNIIIKVSKF